MYYHKLAEGIFVDYGCTGIIPVKGGVLLPDHATCSDIADAYQKDLHDFLTKWFGGVDEVTRSIGRINGPMAYGSGDGTPG